MIFFFFESPHNVISPIENRIKIEKFIFPQKTRWGDSSLVPGVHRSIALGPVIHVVKDTNEECRKTEREDVRPDQPAGCIPSCRNGVVDCEEDVCRNPTDKDSDNNQRNGEFRCELCETHPKRTDFLKKRHFNTPPETMSLVGIQTKNYLNLLLKKRD
jgi:hypothetical protein